MMNQPNPMNAVHEHLKALEHRANKMLMERENREIRDKIEMSKEMNNRDRWAGLQQQVHFLDMNASMAQSRGQNNGMHPWMMMHMMQMYGGQQNHCCNGGYNQNAQLMNHIHDRQLALDNRRAQEENGYGW